MNFYPFILAWWCVLCGMAFPAVAQQVATSPPIENIRIEYAQVLKVEPIYPASYSMRMEEVCDPVAVTPEPEPPLSESNGKEGSFFGVIDTIKSWFGYGANVTPEGSMEHPESHSERRNCRLVQIAPDLQQPVAYNVDYIYQGVKYRSRLSEDPGNRIRLRVSVMPDYPVVAPDTL